jgi:GT2 family glycosyltransferase
MNGSSFSSTPRVSVIIVTFNSAAHIKACLASLLRQTFLPLEIIVIDNNSQDETVAELKKVDSPLLNFTANSVNNGFCGGQNQGIRNARGNWILCFNPDCVAAPDLIERLVTACDVAPHIGGICPKILRLESGEVLPDPPRLDSTGVSFTLALRHFDRGSEQVDTGVYNRPEYVFGFTGAAVLLRREFIDDVSFEGEFFDEDFFAYREDADVSWRAQLLGWRFLYLPSAIVHHIRRVLPDNRKSLPREINMHSVKNRFLMRIKNITPGVMQKVFWPMLFRDMGICVYILVREWYSARGILFVIRNWSRILHKRARIQSRRVASDEYLRPWFSDQPLSMPLEPAVLEKLSAGIVLQRSTR